MRIKRSRQDDDGSSGGHPAKAERTDGGRRRVISGDDGFPVPSSSSPESVSVPRRPSTRDAGARRRDYQHSMAQLNYQHYLWAKGVLESGKVPDDAFYSGIVENYLFHASDLERRYIRIHGDVVVFGQGDCGQLGCGSSVTEARKPRILANMRGIKVSMVASGGLHSLALSQEGTVYSWGCPDEGSLGWLATENTGDGGALPSEVRGFHASVHGPNGKTEDMLDSNGQVVPFEQRKEAIITQIATGETQSLALSTEGDVYMWGTYRDDEGRKFRNLPPEDDTRKVTGFKDMSKLEEDDNPEWFKPPRGNQDWPMHLVEMPQKTKDISAGGCFNAALLKDDTIVTWGLGTCGELARPVPKLDKTTSMDVILKCFLKPQPPLWEHPSKRTVLAISCGGFHLLAVTQERDGLLSVYSSGLNQYGQLGHGDTENREKLSKVEFFEGMGITKVEGGYQFSCFVDSTDRKLYACGRGDYGNLGITLKQPDPGFFENLPCRVPLVYEPRENVSDPKENCIRAEDIIEEKQPEIKQISCGSTHVLVLTKQGDAYSWGFGTSGACGQGKSDDDVLRPRRLEVKHKLQHVSAGGQHSTAVITMGSENSAS